MTEKWKPVRDFPGYLVSNKGKVFTKKRNTLMTPHRRASPHSSSPELQLTAVCLTHNRKKHTMYVHRLVADAFVRRIESEDIVKHLNEDPTDNRAVNLYIVGEEPYHLLRKAPAPQKIDLGEAVLRHHLSQPKKEEKKWKSSTRGSLMTWITSEATSGS